MWSFLSYYYYLIISLGSQIIFLAQFKAELKKSFVNIHDISMKYLYVFLNKYSMDLWI